MRASVSSVQRAAAGLSNLARSLLSLGMGANGYIPPTSDAAREQRGDPDHVAPGTQEHLLGAGDPADLMFNAFGHASALMQELVGAYSTIAEASASSAMCECSPIHRDSACGDPRCRWVRPNFTAERESQDAEYAAAVRADEARDETERQRDEAERALAGPVQVGVVRAARLRRLGAPADAGRESPWSRSFLRESILK